MSKRGHSDKRADVRQFRTGEELRVIEQSLILGMVSRPICDSEEADNSQTRRGGQDGGLISSGGLQCAHGVRELLQEPRPA